MHEVLDIVRHSRIHCRCSSPVISLMKPIVLILDYSIQVILSIKINLKRNLSYSYLSSLRSIVKYII